MGGSEAVTYWLVRGGVAAAGLVAILGTVSSHFFMPELYYDHLPEPPPLRAQLPSIAAGFGVGTLLLVPHRVTMRGWLFWPRLAVSAAVGLFLVGAGLSAIAAGARGGRDPAIFPAGVGLLLTGVSVPGSLWWHRRRTRRCA
ncbi:hypothetical protein GobsT_28840 [Gemmata obscuriglobus]|uniref:Uncharacterized protein n=1 Tax=Gemmata obscuriglobus TaxID=114 RepID=A0A2Z3GZK3_9BACT|nr:hypothetical protein [Gemmata obscuriglobus]AWM38888.1 hypothetical protein C1280_19125 [Gemmata obscuriglobus]QEG28110.1 hypothetical protein GobsT_28840 [Gemmata obscuriglobus]VTS05753.1 unnamed protein product [Gemmata obscuriglobus UQM 2246]